MENSVLKRTKHILEKYKLRAVKQFGQNFLIDQNIISNIIDSANITNETCVLEIGPGLGSLTSLIVKRAKKVIAFEIDKKLIPVLKEEFKDYDNLELINEDFLKYDLNALVIKLRKEFKDIKLVANLPYYITSPILVKVLESENKVDSCIFMLQKELGERLTAKISTKKYNNFSILIQHFSNPELLFNVPPGVFIPAPKVTSCVVRFNIKKDRLFIKNEKDFFIFLRLMFSQKRKTILNNLSNYTKNKDEARKILEKVNINHSLRPENIPVEEFLEIYNEVIR